MPATRLALGVLAAIVVGVVVLAWQMWPKDPGGDSPEAGFLRDMYTHHSQAVGMGMIIRDRTEDPELEALATDIALTQSTQMGTMLGYLDLWDIPLGSSELPMTWMGSPTEGLMPGMAIPEDIERLEVFVQPFEAAKRRADAMEVRYVVCDDPELRTVFEVYAAERLNTKMYNTFETH